MIAHIIRGMACVKFRCNKGATSCQITEMEGGAAGSCCPSLCCKGYIVDSRCPLHIGSGLGTKVYKLVYDLWVSCSSKDDFSQDQLNLARKLAATLQAKLRADSQSVREQIMSGRVSIVIRRFIQTLLECAEFDVVHQTAISDSGQESADVTILDLEYIIHHILEFKILANSDFPEIQACAYAQLCGEANNEKARSWLPVSALSTNHYRVGAALGAILGPQWSYAEIASIDFDPKLESGTLALARFMYFLARSALLHGTLSVTQDDLCCFVCEGDTTVRLETPRVIGDRVLKIESQDGPKVIKFYEDSQAAKDAVARTKVVRSCLGYRSVEPQVFAGFGLGATSLVVDQHWTECSEVKYPHLIELTEQVSKLYEAKLVHGDLRLPNILFLDGGVVRLIDADWSGGRGERRFPAKVNVAAFGSRAAHDVRPYNTIPADFDWLCLADIFDLFECRDEAAAAAGSKDKNRILFLLGKQKKDPKVLFRFSQREVHSYLNLFSLGGRLGAYYQGACAQSKKRKSEDKQKNFDDKE